MQSQNGMRIPIYVACGVNVKIFLAGERGRFPMFIGRQIRIIKYWLNLHSTKNENCILGILNLYLREVAVNNANISTWSSKIKHILERYGFPDVWLFPESLNINKLIPFFQWRLRDLYIVEWTQGIELSSSLYIYKEIKQTFEISPYLFILNNKKLRNESLNYDFRHIN